MTMTITTSEASASARGESPQAAPAASRSAALSLVRFQTVTGNPAAKRRPDICCPIRPIPTNPIRCIYSPPCPFP